jgi:hypothetical protein
VLAQTHHSLSQHKQPSAAAAAVVAKAAAEVPPIPHDSTTTASSSSTISNSGSSADAGQQLLHEDEQRVRIAQLLSLHVQLTSEQLKLLLRYSDWSAQRAAAHYQVCIHYTVYTARSISTTFTKQSSAYCLHRHVEQQNLITFVQYKSVCLLTLVEQ